MKNKKYFRMPKTMDDLMEILENHTQNEDERFHSIDKRLDYMETNHLRHMESDIQSVKINLAELSANVGWTKWGILAILGAMIAGTIGLIFKI